MGSVHKVRLQDASRLKSLLNCETAVAVENKIRGKTIYTDDNYEVLSYQQV